MSVYRVTETPATFVVEVLQPDGTWLAVTEPNQLRTGALRAYRAHVKRVAEAQRKGAALDPKEAKK